jgi:RsmE family RNA methyltransferase
MKSAIGAAYADNSANTVPRPVPPDAQDFIIAIGSERGWSERERKLFNEAFFSVLSLGERALRTETACVAAAALVLV